MSGHGFHVHGPHDHELEHAAAHPTEGEEGKMTSQIAVVTAIIATVGALFSYVGGATQANAGLYKNNAAIKKTEAANQWNYFQSKSTKQSLAEFARDLAVDDKKSAYQSKIDRYEKEKTKAKLGVDNLEAEAVTWDKAPEEQMTQNQRWAQAEFARDLAADAKKAAYQGKIDRYEKEKNDIKIVAEKLEAEALAWDKSSDEQLHQHHRWAQATTVLQVSIAMAAMALLTRKKWLEYTMFGLAGIGVVLGGLAALHI